MTATSDLLRVALAWLADTGAPNWVVLAALLTSPWKWSKAVSKRIGPMFSKVLPSEQRANVAETPDDDPRE